MTNIINFPTRPKEVYSFQIEVEYDSNQNVVGGKLCGKPQLESSDPVEAADVLRSYLVMARQVIIQGFYSAAQQSPSGDDVLAVVSVKRDGSFVIWESTEIETEEQVEWLKRMLTSATESVEPSKD